MMNGSEIEEFYSLFKEPSKYQKNRLFEIKKAKLQKKWTKEEDMLLLELAKRYNSKCWKKISSHFEDKTPLQCFSRFKRIRPGIIKGSWTKEEDQKIIEMVAVFGKAWSKISKILVTRNGKQIRDRFINILDPNIKKGKFTIDEDLKLLSLYRRFGTKWATISKYFENRTADMIKNRYHSSIKKNMKFLEDLEAEYSYSNLNKDCLIFNESLSRFECSAEGSTTLNNMHFEPNDYSQNLLPLAEEDKQKKKDFECLVPENAISISYLQTTFCPSPSWQLEDYFVL